MKIRVLAFGKLKTPGTRELVDHYTRQARAWATLEEEELRPIEVPDKSLATRELIREKEADLVRARVGTRPGVGKLYLLDERGKAMPTSAWAELARTWETSGASEVVLAIGGSLGFSEKLRKEAAGVLSFGPQTVSHELARVLTFEQLYRALSVLRGHPYHNEG